MDLQRLGRQNNQNYQRTNNKGDTLNHYHSKCRRLTLTFSASNKLRPYRQRDTSAQYKPRLGEISSAKMAWYSICRVLAFCLHLGNSSMIRYPREAGVAASTASITISHDASAALASKPAATAIVIISFVLLFALVALSALKYQSPTIDEPVHLLAGYSYLKWGDFRVNPEHPPLAKLLAALPLLARDIKDPRPTAPEWQQIPKQAPGLPTAKVALEMFFVQNDAEALFFYAKLPFLVLTIFLGLAVFIWAREWFGLEAGVAALLLFASNPNIIAHSTIVHTDMAFAALFFVGTYFLAEDARGQALAVRFACLPGFRPRRGYKVCRCGNLSHLESARGYLHYRRQHAPRNCVCRRQPKQQTSAGERFTSRKFGRCVCGDMGGVRFSL